MIDNHGKNKKIIESLTNKPAWYIEVVAVDPAYQGRKLGSTMVRSLLDLCPPDSAIYLECTDAKNVGFYEKFGFKTVLEIMLKDPTVESDIGVELWLMARF
ncbi:hypothetical protein MPH_07667 [Macrophomina phaseolina MS6]|uniref:N-acetyltransferase domain-containing protein n=1 Tax=Macrophomina phaseolina (strain MS6) TaxID=1126212 RepID=K2QYW0_MACPH|nr:hypothetical protein MPH_07667 [Macrophomina phaseolina MS6]